jgi:hypothetical protein
MENTMQIRKLIYGLAAAALVAVAFPALSEPPPPYHGLSEEEREEVRERWDEMSPEERAEVRRRADAYWAGLSEEERAAKREELRQHRGDGARGEARQLTNEERQAYREEMRKRWEAMTPEERQAHRGMMRSPQAADPKDGAYGKPEGEAGADGKSKNKGKPKD